MPSMKSRLSPAAGALAGALFLMPFPGAAQEPTFPPEQIAKGASIFSRNCSPCHGTRMQNPESAFDLTKFQVYDTGSTITFRVQTADLTPTFGSTNGAQLVDVYVSQPGATPTSSAASYPSMNYTTATPWS